MHRSDIDRSRFFNHYGRRVGVIGPGVVVFPMAYMLSLCSEHDDNICAMYVGCRWLSWLAISENAERNTVWLAAEYQRTMFHSSPPTVERRARARELPFVDQLLDDREPERIGGALERTLLVQRALVLYHHHRPLGAGRRGHNA